MGGWVGVGVGVTEPDGAVGVAVGEVAVGVGVGVLGAAVTPGFGRRRCSSNSSSPKPSAPTLGKDNHTIVAATENAIPARRKSLFTRYPQHRFWQRVQG